MKRRLILAGLAFAALSTTGCQRLAIGDSVLWQSQGALKANVAVDVDAGIGRGPDSRPFGDGLTLRESIVQDVPFIDSGGWLIVQEAGDHAVTAEFVQWVVDYVRDDVCVAWVTPNNVWEPIMNAMSVEAIKSILPQQPCHRVIDWSSVDTTDLTTDGLHLSAVGQQVFGRFVAEALR